MDIAIFLGGGASAAEGAPVQTELFQAYFGSINHNRENIDQRMLTELTAYFRDVFNIDINSTAEDKIFPTFEEALGMLDLAVRRGEALKNYGLANISNHSNRIGFLRQYLIMLLAAVLDGRLLHNNGLHESLVLNLDRCGLLKNTMFLTTNYDTLIDHALSGLEDYRINYGANCDNYPDRDIGKHEVHLYKLHGSLNWLYCSVCNRLNLIRHDKGVIRLVTEPERTCCFECNSTAQPVIVPPTFYKDMTNVFLHMVWHKAELALRRVRHIIFCGYSFPDADMHIKYLIKRIQTNRQDNLKITVINYHPGKAVQDTEAERLRYIRFLGDGVNYSEYSFESFAANPAMIINGQ